MNKQELFDKLRDILVETFEIPAGQITLGSNLYDELGIDSIDAVDLIVKLKSLTGKKLQPETFKSVRTLEDVIDALLKETLA